MDALGIENRKLHRYSNLKQQVYKFLETAGYSNSAKAFHSSIMLLIILNVVAVMLGTVENIETQYSFYFDLFEVFSIAVFTIEYFLRIWSCNWNPIYKGRFIGRIRFALTPMALIDLLSFLPFYIPMAITIDLRFLRMFRLFRVFRIFKLGRYSEAYRLIFKVVSQKSEYLNVSLIFVLSLLVLASSLMYFTEHEAQPEVFSSIPSTLWWAVVTLTTVGYGDVYPVTPLGKFLSAIIAMLGIGLFALPAGILASGFSEELSRKHERLQRCPHCGKEF
jgi:Ion transport protein.